MLCTEFGKWVHKRWFASQNVLYAHNYDYVRPSYDQPDGGDGVEQENVMEEVDTLTYLGDVFDKDVRVERAVHGRMVAVWSKLQEISGLSCNRRIPLQTLQHL